MGIGPANLTAYLWWHAEGWLKPGGSMLDIGAQELFCEADPAALNRFIATFGGEPFPDDELMRVASRGLAGTAMQRAGLRYSSIDFKPYPFGIVLDLNRDRLPEGHRGAYDAVTNHGTSEHILNQWNVFETMHDAAKPGAMMYHCVPFCGATPAIGQRAWRPRRFPARSLHSLKERIWEKIYSGKQGGCRVA